MKTIALAGALLALAPCAMAQEADLTQLLSGTSMPLSYKLKELTPEWKHVKVTSTEGSSGMGDMLGNIMKMAMLGNKSSKPDDMMGIAFMSSMFGGGDSANVYFTRGQHLTVAGENFLVAYAAQKKQMDLMSMIQAGDTTNPQQMLAAMRHTEDDTLSLTLLNVKTIGTLGDIRPFNLQSELQEQNSSLAPLMAMTQTAPTVEEKPGKPAKRPTPVRKGK